MRESIYHVIPVPAHRSISERFAAVGEKIGDLKIDAFCVVLGAATWLKNVRENMRGDAPELTHGITADTPVLAAQQTSVR